MDSLVIGYGNDLRSDDGAGRVAADRIAALGLPRVGVKSVSQLTPELALEMAGVRTVVFVDASVDVARTTVTRLVTGDLEPPVMTHFADPAALLALTGTVGAAPARAFAVSIPVTDLGLGLELSPLTEAGVAEAVEKIIGLICE